MSKAYTTEADIIEIPEKNEEGNFFFRKYINDPVKCHYLLNELYICEELMSSPQKRNILQVYKVDKGPQRHIDIELLETNISKQQFIDWGGVQDIQNCLEYLHSMGIVYIDFKIDNIGYSKKDRCFKLFDFDCSGLVNPADSKKWVFRPFIGYNYQDACEKGLFGINQCKFEGDWFLFRKFVNEITA